MVVSLDALGTLVELSPPAPRLVALLAEQGFEVGEEQAADAFAAEISYYLEHHLEGADRASLDRLRDRCADVLRAELGLPGLDRAATREAMLGALRFEAFPEALEVLALLREGGHRLLIVSNWDCSLPSWLAHTGLLELVEASDHLGGGGQRQAGSGNLRARPRAGGRACRSDGARGRFDRQ